MISNISVLLFIATATALTMVIFKPDSLKRFTRGLSKKQIILRLSSAMILLIIIIGISTPESANNLQESSQQNVSSKTELLQTESKDVEEKQVVAFSEQRIETDNLAQGEEQVIQEGRDGEKTLIYSVTYASGQEISRTLKSEMVTVQPVDKIISVGTYIASNSNTSSSNSSNSSNVYYKNCTAARAAGVTPIYAGQPGYASHLDRDNDGIACED